MLEEWQNAVNVVLCVCVCGGGVARLVCGRTAAAWLTVSFSEYACVCMLVRSTVCGRGKGRCVCVCVVRESEFSQANRRGINVEFTPSGQGNEKLISAYKAAAGSKCGCV